ncbi:GNAT family N-acetyltransferase [Saccharibacillus qingshengii]|uniref:GNAT family N-acetyltransferase n=1 Tax=Saccharibacillus qingshengii TaxID=1763540 RepID=UPI001553DDE4|nr:GNAT family N-acetyltransferase [Saccharibacillus qingshengii]
MSTSRSLLPSPALIESVEQSEIDYMTDRMRAIQSRPGNPEKIEIQTFGRATAFTSETMPWPAFNTVKGLADTDIGQLEPILEFFRARGRKVQLEIVPSRVGPDFLGRMAELGLYASGVHASLIAQPREIPDRRSGSEANPDRIVIRELHAGEMETYAMLHCRGTGLPDHGILPVQQNNEVLHGREGWTFLIAESDGTPAATAVLFERDRRASLTFAATLPEFRGRGLHRRLIERRIGEAFSRNNELVVGQCAFLSQSHRNMEHAGMRLGYVRTAWTEANTHPAKESTPS